jgi:hypothetical protein
MPEETKEAKQPDAKLIAKAEEIKKGIDQLIAAQGRSDTKRVFYWVGLVSRQLTELGRECLGLDPLKEEKGLITPEKKLIT